MDGILYEVQVRGDHLSATLDRVRVLDGHDQEFEVGYIGLQHHRDNKIEFRISPRTAVVRQADDEHRKCSRNQAGTRPRIIRSRRRCRADVCTGKDTIPVL